MAKIAFDFLGIAAGLAFGLALALLTMRHLRRSKHGGAVAFASALLFSFDIVNPRNHDMIQEATNDTKRKKDSQSGDPPVAGR